MIGTNSAVQVDDDRRLPSLLNSCVQYPWLLDIPVIRDTDVA